MKRSPLLRKSRLKARKPLRSKGKVKPTEEDWDRMGTIKRLGCLACWLNLGLTLAEMIREAANTSLRGRPLCEAHHLKDGNQRRGHQFTIGLCPWHHDARPPTGTFSKKAAERELGPSLQMDARAFHERYGSDDELLAIQNLLLNAVQMKVTVSPHAQSSHQDSVKTPARLEDAAAHEGVRPAAGPVEPVQD